MNNEKNILKKIDKLTEEIVKVGNVKRAIAYIIAENYMVGYYDYQLLRKGIIADHLMTLPTKLDSKSAILVADLLITKHTKNYSIGAW